MSQDALWEQEQERRRQAEKLDKPVEPYIPRERFPTCSGCGVSGPGIERNQKGDLKCPDCRPKKSAPQPDVIQLPEEDM